MSYFLSIRNKVFFVQLKYLAEHRRDERYPCPTLYRQQQNKWYPQRCLLTYFESTLYYVQVNLLRLKWNEASKWASRYLWGYHLFCC